MSLSSPGLRLGTGGVLALTFSPLSLVFNGYAVADFAALTTWDGHPILGLGVLWLVAIVPALCGVAGGGLALAAALRWVPATQALRNRAWWWMVIALVAGLLFFPPLGLCQLVPVMLVWEMPPRDGGAPDGRA